MSESHKTGAFQYHQRRPLGPIYGGCSDVVFQLPTSNFEHTTMISGCVWRTVFLFKFSLCIFVNCGLEKFRYHISWLWVILNVFFLKKQLSLRQYKLELPIFLLSTFGNWLKRNSSIPWLSYKFLEVAAVPYYIYLLLTSWCVLPIWFLDVIQQFSHPFSQRPFLLKVWDVLLFSFLISLFSQIISKFIQ